MRAAHCSRRAAQAALFAACLAPTTLAAQAGGFTEQQLAEAAAMLAQEAAPDAVQRADLARRSEDLRQVLALDQASLDRAVDRAGLRALTVAMGPPAQDRDILLSWFARGGHVAVASADLSGIYNPFADGWLLLRWQQVGGAPRLVRAALVSGRLLRGDMPAVPGEADMPFAQVLVARRLHALAAFEELGSQMTADDLFTGYAPLRESQTEGVLEESRRQLGSLAQWSRENDRALAALERLIERGNDPALLSIPSRLHDALGPVALVATPSGYELMLQAPTAPARTIVATFGLAPDPAGSVTDDQAPRLFALNLAPQQEGSMIR